MQKKNGKKKMRQKGDKKIYDKKGDKIGDASYCHLYHNTRIYTFSGPFYYTSYVLVAQHLY